MIRYPVVTKGSVIGCTAPSSGVEPSMYKWLREAEARLLERGWQVQFGPTVWQQEKAKSAPARLRADELNVLLRDDRIGLIVPPWGGELLIEILEYLDWEAIPAKWILGFSDLSVLLLAITLRTGIATAHGTNLIDLRGESMDETTAMWLPVLATETGQSIKQSSSERYQRDWENESPSPHVYHLTEETYWRTVGGREARMQGRLLGGCVDVIRHLIGTPYGDVARFRDSHIPGERIIWYLENCELGTTDLRRSLVQMRLAGWFDHCSGILFGRSAVHKPVGGYTEEDVFQELSAELGIPLAYDIDCGHMPPQLTLINGAYAEVEVADGRGSVTQYFKA
ncbi:muramoyltetrapeptide carboxypeptidase LdcA involved in peptidoglycan recycling [Paenibacillus phyllosphaerae]|uniref:Muramoyltetrapeptide carboxypeptidase LdcA involved in peptidoglycan recycling n=1 Tax=Paenibacillus phyllosphaerae TaxID=274593 RepID=A0A7W5AYR6_9BACL|nr:S66 peptidase family protein [Paenibacillus phyllosphaerae]MBB3111243.1 muramoyltetrapeptide carboxypeptidase LdcA involved in peptidoglycan recycling [Paenibacillus phyllosphaerae]